jgi:hypothetical protein
MRNIILLFALLTIPVLLTAQEVTFEKRKVNGLTAVKVDPMAIPYKFNANIRQLVAPPPSGNSYRDKLAIQKQKSAALYPRRPSQAVKSRSLTPQPTIERSIKGNTGGIPLDPSLAVNKELQLLGVANNNILVKPTVGPVQLASSLNDFASSLGNAAGMFDPRAIYDPIADKYIMSWLAGNTSNSSLIVIAFSETNDAAGNWNLYALTGDPNNNGQWSDYPMITYTDSEFFLTLNSIRDGESWQEGFARTIIYQINKEEGYLGQELDATLWQEINFNGNRLRNVCPIRPSTAEAGDEIYFMSNRNFDIQNDSIFLMRLSGTQDVATLSVDVLQADLSYGVAPDGAQVGAPLATNDARILDGYLLGDRIEFVGNSIDFDNGRAGIYHGTVSNVSTAPSISANIISNDDEDFGYPSIVYTGLEPEEQDGIILYSHTGLNRFPGHSAIYFDQEGEYSDPLTLREGTSYIDELPDDSFSFERWGDYSMAQRDFADPGMVWTHSSFGTGGARGAGWITQMARPSMNVSTQSIRQDLIEIETYPNPSINDFKVIFEIYDVDNLHITVVDAQGRPIHVIHDGSPKRQGKLEFTMSTAPLEAGMYFLQINADGKLIGNEKIIVQ